jgi:plasmid stabilization system protein ParE
MAYQILLIEEAEKDVDEAVIWYEEQQTNLGIRFYFELLKTLEALKTNPQYYSFLHEEYRQVILIHFPYKIVFKIYADKVVVLAVFHTSRNPAELIKRL